MKIYVKSNSTVFPEVYGYKLYSTMSGNTVMFCSFMKKNLLDHIDEITDLVLAYEPDDNVDTLGDFCDANGIYIVMTDGYTLWQTSVDEFDDYDAMNAARLKDGDYIAEINNKDYKVNIVGSDAFRF